MLNHRHGPVAEKLRSKEEERKELCQSRDETEAVGRAELDGVKSSLETVRANTQHIARYMYHNIM